MGKQTSLYVNERLEAILERYARGRGPGGTLTVIADRYDAIMTIAKRSVRYALSGDELTMLVEDGMSTVFEPAGIIPGAVLADVEDMAFERLVAAGVDRALLVGKLKSFSLAEQFALVDLIEEMRPK